MTTLELTLNLPDEIASKAREAGLLNPAAIERLLREQLRRQAGQELRAMLDKAGAPDAAPMSEEAVQAEIQGYRAGRRAESHDKRGTPS